MILPCRIHRAGNRKRVDSRPRTLIFAVLLALQPAETRAQEAAGSTFEQAGLGWLPAIPVRITAGVDTGYDDNVTLSSNPKSSWFAAENIVLTYDRPGEQTEFFLLGVGRFTQNFDVTGQNEKSGNITMGLTHNFSTRLSFYTNIYAAYQNEPNFQSNVGPQNVRANFFDTRDIFSLTYHWSTRLSLVTSYTFERVAYDQASIGDTQNRIDSTLGEQLVFNLTSRTGLVGEYRYETINYDTAPTDSTTHFLLGGINHNLTEHLIVHVRAGESFRSLEDDGDSSLPYFESSLSYVGSNHTLNWTTSYGFESPTAAGTTTTKTLRTGLNLTYDLTSRLSSVAGIYYHHDDNQGGTGSSGTQDSFDLNVGLRYTLNKHFTLHLDYNHTTLGSMGSTPGYSLYLRRDQLPKDYVVDRPLAMSFLAVGFCVFAFAYWLHFVKQSPAKADYLALETLSFLCCLAAGGFFFLGRDWMRATAFPLSYLIFMVPMPDAMAEALESASKYASAEVANVLFHLSGTPILRAGRVFQLPTITIEVAQECSGIRSSWVLLMTSILAANLFLKTSWRRIVLVAFIIPLGILRNGFRILVIGLLCVNLGPQMIHSPIHTRGGPVFFVLSLIPLFLLLWWLRKSEIRTLPVKSRCGA